MLLLELVPGCFETKSKVDDLLDASIFEPYGSACFFGPRFRYFEGPTRTANEYY